MFTLAGVNTSTVDLEKFIDLISLAELLGLTFDMGMDILFATSSGGVLFDTTGTAMFDGPNPPLAIPPAAKPLPAKPLPANPPPANPPPAKLPPANPSPPELVALRLETRVDSELDRRRSTELRVRRADKLSFSVTNPNASAITANIAFLANNSSRSLYNYDQDTSLPPGTSYWESPLPTNTNGQFDYDLIVTLQNGSRVLRASTPFDVAC